MGNSEIFLDIWDQQDCVSAILPVSFADAFNHILSYCRDLEKFINIGDCMENKWQWLDELSLEDFFCKPLPLEDILTDSVYYPACGGDIRVIRIFKNLSPSFVNVDYNSPEKAPDFTFNTHIIDDYRKIVERRISLMEMTGTNPRKASAIPAKNIDPGSWLYLWIYPTPPHDYPRQEDNLHLDDPMIRGWVAPFKAEWSIWERLSKSDGSKQPKRLSLLKICDDGVATFDELYYTRKIKPSLICFIQSDGFSCNWTQFRAAGLIMHRLAMSNPAGKPDYVYMYRTPDECSWPEYQYKLENPNPDISLFGLYNIPITF